MGILFDFSFDARELLRHVRSVEDCKCLETETTNDALSMGDLQNKKVGVAD